MTFETLEFCIENNLAHITLNRPDKLNSFNQTMHLEMRKALSAIKKNKAVRCLLISARGRGFCAGQDLSERQFSETESPDLGATLENYYNPMLRTLRSFPFPVVCAVNGVAAGAGANIALACDIIFAARSASFMQAFCKIGLVPDCGGSWTLTQQLGRARAMGLAMLGDKINAEQAVSLGLIYRCVEDDKLNDEALSTAIKLANGPTLGLGLIKRAINAAPSNSFDQQLDLERDLQRIAGRTDDYREGVSAFTDKRKPEFKGQ